MIQAVIFDLDGTLVETERLKALSYARAAVELRPHDLTEADVVEAFKDVVGRSRDEVALALMERFGLEDAARARMNEFDATAPWQVFVQIRLRYYETMLADPELLRTSQWPHNVALLHAARRAGYKTALASMSHADQVRHVLEVLGLTDAFDVIATRDDVARGKPDPEIYFLVARRLQVPPEACLVIEDSPVGVQAAQVAGMDVIAVTTPFTQEQFRERNLLDRRWVVDNPDTLPDVVRKRIETHAQQRASYTRGRAVNPLKDRQRLTLGACQARVDERIKTWSSVDFCRRLWRKDPTLWASKPVPELADRLGWLTLPETMHDQAPDLQAFAEQVKADGMRHVVLLGMGGSSLAPEVYERTFGSAPGYPVLLVLDSTHPAAVRGIEAQIDLGRTLFLVSSKSGTTLEPLSFFRYFWQRLSQQTGTPGRHFVAITDPGTPLEALARDRGFRRVFQAPPDVGGRYSALTVFGLVPAALIGMDVHRLLDQAWTMAEASAFCVAVAENPGLALGAALGELAAAGRDKVTFLASPSLTAFPSWLEQLIAESTGKDGKGIVPVADEPPGPPGIYGDDRFFVSLRLEGDDNVSLDKRVDALEAAGHPVGRIRIAEKADLGQEFFRWEVAVAAAGAALGIHPFNQPDVQLAKDLARQAMSGNGSGLGITTSELPVVDLQPSTWRETLTKALDIWLADARPGNYVALQAYLAPTPETTATLQEIRVLLRRRLQLATTLGYGPRFLHSTGQLHKGGPNTGLFLQLTDEPAHEVPVPETDYTFGALIRAQALGDLMALRQRGRRALRVSLGKEPFAGLKRLGEVLHG